MSLLFYYYKNRDINARIKRPVVAYMYNYCILLESSATRESSVYYDWKRFVFFLFLIYFSYCLFYSIWFIQIYMLYVHVFVCVIQTLNCKHFTVSVLYI